MSDRTERQLMDDVEDLGWQAMRAPASGGRPGHDPGDVWVGRKVTAAPIEQQEYGIKVHGNQPTPYTELYVVEEKYKSNEKNKYLQADGEKVDAMIEFAKALGATPLFAGRWSTRVDWSPGATHYIVDARELDRTDAGNVSVKPETAESNFQTTEEYFG